MMFAMFPARLGLVAVMAFAGLTGISACSSDDGKAGSTTSTTERPPWHGKGEDDLWLALDEVCRTANDDAADDAEALLPLDTEPDEHDLARFYRNRAAQVVELAAEFADMTPPAELATQWPELMSGMRDWAAWAEDVADLVAEEGIETDQTQPLGLERFRTSFDWGACALLLDVN